MSAVTAVVDEILRLNAQAKDSYTAAEAISGQTQEKLDELRERIQNGETTGDRIKDYVICRYRTINDEFEQKYRNIELKMKEHHGEEFIFIVTRGERFHGCTGFGYQPKDWEYALEEQFCLGVLDGEQLIFNCAEGFYEFPTGQYVKSYGLSGKALELTPGRIKAGYFEDLIYHLDKPLKCKNSFNEDRKPMQLEVKIGDDEVREWFQSQGPEYQVWFEKAATLFGF